MKTRVSVVITDLDNTLYDWVEIWHKPFKAMLDRLVQDSAVSRERLILDFKAVFQKRGTCEYAFAIEELPSLNAQHPGENLAELYADAIDAYRKARREVMRLYPDVLQSLEMLKDNGCLLVGYTQSMAFYTSYRMRKLGLDRVLDYLYSPPDHDLPRGIARAEIRSYPAKEYELRRTIPRTTPKGQLKPNPDLLLTIIAGLGATPQETIYVGDSLMKDMAMAREAGVTSVWAKYGTAQDRPEYELLRQVTHWSESDVEREKVVTEAEVRPDYTLEASFGEVLEPFQFTSFVGQSQDRLQQAVEAWKKTVDVQQHFNDLELRIRNYAITILAAIFTAAAFTIASGHRLTVFGLDMPLGSALLIVGLVPWGAFYFMDRHWYHRLLLGAVSHAEFIESRINRALPELALTRAISKGSPSKFLRWQIHSPKKIAIFYFLGAVFIVIAALAVFFEVARTGPQKPEGPAESAAGSVPPSSTTQKPEGEQPGTTSGGRFQQAVPRQEGNGADDARKGDTWVEAEGEHVGQGVEEDGGAAAAGKHMASWAWGLIVAVVILGPLCVALLSVWRSEEVSFSFLGRVVTISARRGAGVPVKGVRWHTVESWDVKPGDARNEQTVAREYRFSKPWRLRYGTRPKPGAEDRHFRVVVRRKGSDDAARVVVDLREPELTKDPNGQIINETGTVIVEIDALTRWWTAAIDEEKQGC
jgi:phosphoglycolate phosphatase-like HAD superfamily hydrolase